jgi:hypothetical protein
MSGRALFLERGYDGNVSELREVFVEDVDPSGVDTIVITEKNPHRL